MPASDLLILGGSGLLGTALVAEAETLGLDWAATHHIASREGGRWHRIDLTDPTAVDDLLAATAPRAIVNAAYVQNGDSLWPLTAELPGRLARYSSGVARLVHVSSDVVFDGSPERPYREDDPVGPVHDYGRAKVAAERAVAEADPAAVIVRTSLLWGGAGDGGPQVRLVQDPGVRFFTDEYRNPLDVESLASACLELVERTDIRGPLHVAGPHRVDRLTFARALAPLAGIDPDSLQGGTGADQPGRPADVSLDTSLAVSLLDTELRGLPSAD
ncbi:MAG: sugar nucleotide-binding protein [Actinomycetota bacterium]